MSTLSRQRRLLEWVERRIRKVLSEAGIVGKVIDAAGIRGSLPSAVQSTIEGANLKSTGASSGDVPTADGSGGVAWAAQSGGGMANPMTAEGDIITGGAVTGGVAAPARLAKGTDSQVLTVDPTTHLPVWANSAAGFADPTTTKGDLIVHGATTTRLAVGADGQVLTADSAQAEGVKWADPSGGTPDASTTTYTPTTVADWDSSADPGNVDGALDQLASRVKTVEGAGGGGGYTEGAQVHHSVNQSVANSTPLILTWDTELYDTDDIHDTATNPSRLTCKTAGKYLIHGNIMWTQSTAGLREIWLAKNGAVQGYIDRYPDNYNTSTEIMLVLDLAADDYMELAVFQNSGSSKEILHSASGSPRFTMQRIG